MIVFDGVGKNQTSDDLTFVNDDAVLIVSGTFSGESIYVDVKYPDGTYLQLSDGEYTSQTEKLLRLWRGAVIRLRTSNGGGTPSFTARFEQRDLG